MSETDLDIVVLLNQLTALRETLESGALMKTLKSPTWESVYPLAAAETDVKSALARFMPALRTWAPIYWERMGKAKALKRSRKKP